MLKDQWYARVRIWYAIHGNKGTYGTKVWFGEKCGNKGMVWWTLEGREGQKTQTTT